jgi:LacI family transcriptional regulator
VVNPAEQIGFEAARLLDQIMTGQRPLRKPRFLPPTHVVTRQSTDIVAINDPDVSAAVALIHRQAMQPLRVSDIAREVGVARRGLERRFRKLLGRSPLDEIHRVKIERAKGLLVNTDLAIPAVARAAGFGSPQRLGAIFRQHTGVSPHIFRRDSRRPGGLS